MQMDKLYKKWLPELNNQDRRSEFYNDLVSMMTFYYNNGEETEHNFPRG